MDKINPASAIETLSFLAKRLGPLLELAPKLESVKTLEDYAAELAASNDKLLLAIEKAKEDLSAIKKSIAKAKSDSEDILAKAKSNAETIVESAKKEFERISDEAAYRADTIVQEAARQSTDIIAKIDRKADEIAALDTEIAAKKRILDDVKAEIEVLKSKF